MIKTTLGAAFFSYFSFFDLFLDDIKKDSIIMDLERFLSLRFTKKTLFDVYDDWESGFLLPPETPFNKLKFFDGKFYRSNDPKIEEIFSLLFKVARVCWDYERDIVSFKINFKDRNEIFVFSENVVGIMFRENLVCRGGVRQIDQLGNLYMEVKSLWETQKIKNSVVVPGGGKAGFFAQKFDRVAAYQDFIRGILNLADNLTEAGVARNPKLIMLEEELDSYLVVAADKGTADLGDLANLLALEQNFWLGDAFASGGSNGFNHKELAVTSLGAIESLKAHLNKLGRSFAEPLTIVGIGDMSGDVFGNFINLIPQPKIIAAFDGKNIFIDPRSPEEYDFYGAKEEFLRLKANNLNWSFIEIGCKFSKGKLLTLPVEVKDFLDLKDKEIVFNELIKKILKIPADILFFGGIGLYIKNNDNSFKDLTNFAIAPDEVKAKIIVEGANIAIENSCRYQLAAKGVLLNTDFFDNFGGVNCSDYEVNLKLLLGKDFIAEDLKAKLVKQIIKDAADCNAVLDLMEQKLVTEKPVMVNASAILAEGVPKVFTRPFLALLLFKAKAALKQFLLQYSDNLPIAYLLERYFEPFVDKGQFDFILHPLAKQLAIFVVVKDFTNKLGFLPWGVWDKDFNARMLEYINNLGKPELATIESSFY